MLSAAKCCAQHHPLHLSLCHRQCLKEYKFALLAGSDADCTNQTISTHYILLTVHTIHSAYYSQYDYSQYIPLPVHTTLSTYYSQYILLPLHTTHSTYYTQYIPLTVYAGHSTYYSQYSHEQHIYRTLQSAELRASGVHITVYYTSATSTKTLSSQFALQIWNYNKILIFKRVTLDRQMRRERGMPPLYLFVRPLVIKCEEILDLSAYCIMDIYITQEVYLVLPSILAVSANRWMVGRENCSLQVGVCVCVCVCVCGCMCICGCVTRR